MDSRLASLVLALGSVLPWGQFSVSSSSQCLIIDLTVTPMGRTDLSSRGCEEKDGPCRVAGR